MQFSEASNGLAIGHDSGGTSRMEVIHTGFRIEGGFALEAIENRFNVAFEMQEIAGRAGESQRGRFAVSAINLADFEHTRVVLTVIQIPQRRIEDTWQRRRAQYRELRA